MNNSKKSSKDRFLTIIRAFSLILACFCPKQAYLMQKL